MKNKETKVKSTKILYREDESIAALPTNTCSAAEVQFLGHTLCLETKDDVCHVAINTDGSTTVMQRWYPIKGKHDEEQTCNN